MPRTALVLPRGAGERIADLYLGFVMKNVLLACLLLVLPVAIGGCAGDGRYGGLVWSDAVTASYRANETNPDYTYYYFGSEHRPGAVIGIERSYTVDARFWYPVTLDRERLQAWSAAFETGWERWPSAARFKGRYRGAEILDPGGRRVGTWYSQFDWGVFAFAGDVITAYPPSHSPAYDIDVRDKRD